jgi:hypothetical protein
MFHACVQRFDGMEEKIFGGKLNRALDIVPICVKIISCSMLYYKILSVSVI